VVVPTGEEQNRDLRAGRKKRSSSCDKSRLKENLYLFSGEQKRKRNSYFTMILLCNWCDININNF